jgi:hypothetical protein
MTQKDLAEEYANERLQGRLSGNEISFSDNIVFTEEDIKAAFNAGRESVFDDFPKLLYKEEEDGLLAVDIFDKVCLIHKLKGDSQYVFVVDYNESTQRYDTLEEAKLAANEDYKKRIKQALGL